MRRGDLSSPRSTVTLGDSRQLQTGAVGALSKYGGAVSVAEAPGVALIRTKVHGPIARPLVPRPALVDRLVHGPARRLTLVRGQAGWGKSSLLAAWSASDPREFAWLSLDRGDNDPVRFFMYAIEALQSLAGSVGERSASILRTPGVDIVDQVLPILINELDALPESCVFVLEDYHAIDNAEVHEAVSYLLDHAPASLELVLSTRVEPPLPLSRLRGRGGPAGDRLRGSPVLDHRCAHLAGRPPGGGYRTVGRESTRRADRRMACWTVSGRIVVARPRRRPRIHRRVRRR